MSNLIPSDFIPDIYLELNPDVGEYFPGVYSIKHYIKFGINEGRIYKYSQVPHGFSIETYLESLNKRLELNNYSDPEYEKMLVEYYNLTNLSRDEIFKNAKLEYRYFCYRYTNYIRSLHIPTIPLESKLEAVIVEYRCLPNIEFVIRNCIIKLGGEWAHAVICGNLNYDYMKNICNKISENVKVIKTDYDNLMPEDYNLFLTNEKFWNNFSGEKILIYQEDSCIFKNNISDFLKWDYVGAPWPKNYFKEGYISVGNGGFSLRTKQCMIDVINKCSVNDFNILSDSVKDYMNKNNLTVCPEDVYFTQSMQQYNIGLVADWDSAYSFSSESFFNPTSFGGHNFWLNESNWKKPLYENVVIQFKKNYDIGYIEHRGGWKSIIEILSITDFYNNNSTLEFIDVIEKQFLWESVYCKTEKWFGIIHCTQSAPDYLNMCNIQNIFKNTNFISSLNHCKGIFTLSSYVSRYLREKFIEININVKVITLKHPVDKNNIIMFNFSDFLNNSQKKIIQIGQQLRKMTSIYLLNVPTDYQKLWLTGTRDFEKCNRLLQEEIKYLNITEIDTNKVDMYYTKTFEEYDDLLAKNIVFVDLFDAAANNVVLECIARNTPLIINKLEAVVEYLGEDYPLYFTHLNEVNSLLTNDKLFQAHDYLKNMNKTDIDIYFFTRNIITFTNKEINS